LLPTFVTYFLIDRLSSLQSELDITKRFLLGVFQEINIKFSVSQAYTTKQVDFSMTVLQPFSIAFTFPGMIFPRPKVMPCPMATILPELAIVITFIFSSQNCTPNL
jgi:hypothetical protein